MGSTADRLTKINDLVNEYEATILPGGLTSKTIPECLTDLAAAIPQLTGAASFNPMESAAVQKLFSDPVEQVKAAARDLKALGGELVDDTKDIFSSGGSLNLADLLNAPLSPLFIQAQMVENLTNTFIAQLQGDGSNPTQKAFAAQLEDAFGGLFSVDTVTQLAALLYYAVGEQLPAIDQQRTILRSMRRTLRSYRNQVAGLPPSMIPGIPNSLAIRLLCEAEQDLKAAKAGLQSDQTLDRSRFGSAGTRVCQAQSAVGGDLGSLPPMVQAQARELFGLSDLQFKTLLTGKFMPDPRFRLQQIALQNQNAQIQALDVSLVAFNKNLKSIQAQLELNLQIADVFATVIEVLIRAIQTCRAQLEASGAGFDVYPQLARLTGGVTTAEYNRQHKMLGRNAEPNDIARLPESKGDSVVGGIANALQTQYSVYVQLLVLCGLMEKLKAALPFVERILKANDQLGNFLEKFAEDLACSTEASGAEGLSAAVARVVNASEKRLRGTEPASEQALSSCDSLDQAIDDHERWLQCMEKACNQVVAAFGLAAFADAIAMAGKIAYLGRRVAALARSLLEFDYSTVFAAAKTNNAFDAIVEALQCLAQCDNPKVTTILDDQMSILNGLSAKLDATLLSLPVLQSLHINTASVGSNRRLSNLLKLIRSLQALTSMTPTDICGLPTDPAPTPASPVAAPALGILVPRPTATETSAYRGSLSATA